MVPIPPNLALAHSTNTTITTTCARDTLPANANANVVTNPLDQLSSSIENGLEQWSDRSDSAYSWHDHTYQTIPTDPIYHTLEPNSNTTTIPVMLPNGRMVPATLVRNSSGRLMPFVQMQSTSGGVPTSNTSANTTPLHSAARSGQQHTNLSAGNSASQVTFPKTIVYKSPSPRSGYLV